MKAISTWKSPFQSVLTDSKGHEVTIDLPEAKGGNNFGATALDLCVMSLAGCINTIFAIIAQKMHLNFSELATEIEAIKPDTAATITEVNCVIKLKTDAPQERIANCVQKTIETCPVGTIFRNAGITIKHEVKFL